MAPKRREENFWTEPCYTPGPGPGAYKLPSIVGGYDQSKWRYPAYSLAKRVNPLQPPQTPGPIYNVSGLNRYGKQACRPGFSLSPRLEPLKKAYTPGPGEHAPENYPHPSKRSAPAFSLAPRTEISARFNTPGPNQYPLPSTLGGATITIKRAPTAYLAGRLDREEVTKSPGPAAYGVPKYNAVMHSAPKVHINGRLKFKEEYKSPGPTAYYPTYNTGPNAPSYTMRPAVGKCVKPLITMEDLCD